MPPSINKFVIAALGAIALLAYLGADGLTTEEWRQAILAFATAAGVWLVPNTPRP